MRKRENMAASREIQSEKLDEVRILVSRKIQYDMLDDARRLSGNV